MQSKPDQTPPSRGIIYVAYGERFLKQAEVSARSVREHMPEIPIVVYTDGETHEPSFTRVEQHPRPRLTGVKIKHIRESPFDQTLFLDTDTYVCEDLSNLFPLLSRFDLAAVHSHLRHMGGFHGPTYSRLDQEYREEAPPCFTEPNSGVLLYRRCPQTDAMFAEWNRLHELFLEKYQIRVDQPAFRIALFRHRDVRLYNLEPEYNWRALYVNFAYERVKIIHVHDYLVRTPLDKLARRINKSPGPRFYIPNWGVIRKPTGGVFRLINHLRNRQMLKRDKKTGPEKSVIRRRLPRPSAGSAPVAPRQATAEKL